MSTLDAPTTPNPSTVSYRATALRYGAIWGGASVLLTLIGYLTNTDPSLPTTGVAAKAIYGILGFGISIWAIVMAIKHHRDNELGGFISLGRGVMIGLTVGLVAGLIGAFFMLLYTTVINPDFADTLKASMEQQWADQGMSEEQIEAAGKFSGFMFNPVFTFLSQFLGGGIMGLIIGLIGGAVMKRERPLM